MSDTAFLIDVGVREDARRFVGRTLADVLTILSAPRMENDLEYLRVERLKPVIQAEGGAA